MEQLQVLQYSTSHEFKFMLKMFTPFLTHHISCNVWLFKIRYKQNNYLPSSSSIKIMAVLSANTVPTHSEYIPASGKHIPKSPEFLALTKLMSQLVHQMLMKVALNIVVRQFGTLDQLFAKRSRLPYYDKFLSEII